MVSVTLAVALLPALSTPVPDTTFVLLVDHGLATSVSDAGRKIQQGAVRLDEARFSELRWSPIHSMDTVVTVGRKAFRLKVIADGSHQSRIT
jgi:tyrosyl-tRNA synthetase